MKHKYIHHRILPIEIEESFLIIEKKFIFFHSQRDCGLCDWNSLFYTAMIIHFQHALLEEKKEEEEEKKKNIKIRFVIFWLQVSNLHSYHEFFVNSWLVHDGGGVIKIEFLSLSLSSYIHIYILDPMAPREENYENLKRNEILKSTRSWRLKERLPVRSDDFVTFSRGRNYPVPILWRALGGPLLIQTYARQKSQYQKNKIKIPRHF